MTISIENTFIIVRIGPVNSAYREACRILSREVMSSLHPAATADTDVAMEISQSIGYQTSIERRLANMSETLKYEQTMRAAKSAAWCALITLAAIAATFIIAQNQHYYIITLTLLAIAIGHVVSRHYIHAGRQKAAIEGLRIHFVKELSRYHSETDTESLVVLQRLTDSLERTGEHNGDILTCNAEMTLSRDKYKEAYDAATVTNGVLLTADKELRELNNACRSRLKATQAKLDASASNIRTLQHQVTSYEERTLRAEEMAVGLKTMHGEKEIALENMLKLYQDLVNVTEEGVMRKHIARMDDGSVIFTFIEDNIDGVEMVSDNIH